VVPAPTNCRAAPILITAAGRGGNLVGKADLERIRIELYFGCFIRIDLIVKVGIKLAEFGL